MIYEVYINLEFEVEADSAKEAITEGLYELEYNSSDKVSNIHVHLIENMKGSE